MGRARGWEATTSSHFTAQSGYFPAQSGRVKAQSGHLTAQIEGLEAGVAKAMYKVVEDGEQQ